MNIFAYWKNDVLFNWQAGGTIADVFSAKQRGLAMTLFAAAPFMGPALGPVVGRYSSYHDQEQFKQEKTEKNSSIAFV